MSTRTSPSQPDNPVARLVAACEHQLGVRITVNDLSSRLRQYLPSDRCFHANRFCQCVKSVEQHNQLCGRFCARRVPAELARRGHGFWKLCHGGIVEWVSPLWEGEVLAGRVYAGAFRWPEDLPRADGLLCSRARSPSVLLAPALYEELAPVGAARLADLPELMQAFATELMARVASRERVPDGERTRKWQIEHYLGLNFTRPVGLPALARVLHLSVSRTGQVVRELFGRPFADVLREVRMRHARDLLTHTAFSVTEIAERCGIPDPGYFHRIFKQTHGVTPLAFRGAHQGDVLV